ncbi:MAG: SAM-dependent methyltransferase [Gorillibacterium sp.]|nr:SAM-dependent methyltransferase [Gorillibacterium sp.]
MTQTPNKQPIYRFSEAPIWQLQRSYYQEQGLKAWQNEEVPQYITNNPMIAMAYAEIIFGFLQDRTILGFGSEPVMILELGAGSGRLAFHILQELGKLREYADIPLPPFRYVMSDFVEKNIAYWQQHQSLLPFVQQGILDFALFDAVHDTELHLTQSGTVIRPNDLQQPLLVVANYFFDSIPQELIYVGDGEIYECRVSLQNLAEVDEHNAPIPLEKVVPEYHYQRATEYEQESYPYRDVIELYKHKLEDSHILFPTIGLACLDRLHQLSQAGFLLLTADKGDHRLENWEFAEPPKLIHHGSFSLTANYHAIQHVFEQKGALTYFTTHHYKNLNVGCILMLHDPTSHTNTRLAYRRFVDRFGPDDFFSLKQWFDEHLEQMELPQICSFWRLSGYDAQLFLQSKKRIIDLLSSCSEEDMHDLRHGIQSMWTGYYPMEEKHDLALDCGVLLFQMDLFEAALSFFEKSPNVNQASPDILYPMAVCCYEVGLEEAAQGYLLQALAIEPKHEEALSLLLVLNES